MGDADSTNKLPALKAETSDDLATSGVRRRNVSLPDVLSGSTRALLELALGEGTPVCVALRGDPAKNLPVRIVEGIVRAIDVGRDGQERVTIDLSADSSQVVLLTRIVHVSKVK